MASTLAVKSVVTLQVATIALADQGTILMATLERAKVCAACHEDQGRSQDFSKGGVTDRDTIRGSPTIYGLYHCSPSCISGISRIIAASKAHIN